MVGVEEGIYLVLLEMARRRAENLSAQWHAHLDQVTPSQVSAQFQAPWATCQAIDLGKKILDQGSVVAPVERDFIRSLMDCFVVQKDSNIRLVYNGTSCGLNDALWAPNFFGYQRPLQQPARWCKFTSWWTSAWGKCS
jgi:hypothetical protein